MDKIEIEYPCSWSYKVIGTDSDYLKKTIPEILENFEYQFSESNQSKTGKYTSFTLTAHVKDEEQRDKVFNILKCLPGVKMVL